MFLFGFVVFFVFFFFFFFFFFFLFGSRDLSWQALPNDPIFASFFVSFFFEFFFSSSFLGYLMMTSFFPSHLFRNR